MTLKDLETETPGDGFELAIELSRGAVKATRPGGAAGEQPRQSGEVGAASLTEAAQVVAINFLTVAMANGFWRGAPRRE